MTAGLISSVYPAKEGVVIAPNISAIDEIFFISLSPASCAFMLEHPVELKVSRCVA